MYFTINDVKLYYEKFGNNKNKIIILPGWGDNRNTFHNIIDNLKDKYTIYIFDYPGFGNSNFSNSILTIYDYCTLIIEFMKKNNIINPIIISHSFGGRITILMNSYFNIPLKKIILIDSAGIKNKKTFYQKIKSFSYKLLKKISKLFPKKYKDKYLEWLISIFSSNDYKNLPECMRKTFVNIINEDLTKYLNKINVETLIIWGEKDIDTPLSDAIKMNKLIKDSGLIIVKNASHFCYLEYPKYINIIINELLKEKD